MANNAVLQNAALAGFLSGAFQSSPSSASAAFYANACNAAQAFAERVDSKIPLDATLVSPVDSVTLNKVNLLGAICRGVIAGRYPLSATAADYDALATAVAALYTQGVTELV